MKFAEFAHRYSKTKPHTRYEPNDARRTLIEDTAEWSGQYADLIQKTLEGGSNNAARALHLNARYRTWIQGRFLPLHKKVSDEIFSADEYSEGDLDDISEFYQTNVFNLLNTGMYELWPYAVSAEKIPRALVRTIKIHLAMLGTSQLSDINEAYTNGQLFEEDGKLVPYYSFEMGVTNEVDTAVALLHISERHPDVAVVPSPGKFEHGHDASKNSDFLAINTVDEQIRGVQAKTKVNKRAVKTYDPSLITLIDGEADLDNTITLRRMARSSNLSHTAWPGLISAHTMLEEKQAFRAGGQQGKNVTMTPWHNHVVATRLRAREVSRGTRSSTRKAGTIVLERVMRDMYKS